jgi:hypothetical protein
MPLERERELDTPNLSLKSVMRIRTVALIEANKCRDYGRHSVHPKTDAFLVREHGWGPFLGVGGLISFLVSFGSSFTRASRFLC